VPTGDAGQVYPTEKSNNTVYNASAAGTITKIAKVEDEDGSSKYEVSIQDGETVVERIPQGPELIISEGQAVKVGDALTNNPNVGGFGRMMLKSFYKARHALN